MNTFYIARHGETKNNRARRLSGWADTPLTESGLVPTESVVQKLRNFQLDKIYSSDLGRALTTAYFIAQSIGYREEVISTSGLREVSYGDAANMLSTEAYALYPDLDRNTHFVPPNGESLEHMQGRVFECIDEINDQNECKAILLVCHSGVMAALRANHIGQDFGEHNISEAYPHDYVGKFTFKNSVVISFDQLTN